MGFTGFSWPVEFLHQLVTLGPLGALLPGWIWVPPDELDEDIAMSSAAMSHTALRCSASTSEKNRHLCWLSWLVGWLQCRGKLMDTMVHQTKKNTQTQEHNQRILVHPVFFSTGRSFDVFFLNKNGSEQKPRVKVPREYNPGQPPPIKK